jgi:hypothetical protein
MVSVLALRTVDCEFEPGRANLKTIKLLYVATMLSLQHE